MQKKNKTKQSKEKRTDEFRPFDIILAKLEKSATIRYFSKINTYA